MRGLFVWLPLMCAALAFAGAARADVAQFWLLNQNGLGMRSNVQFPHSGHGISKLNSPVPKLKSYRIAVEDGTIRSLPSRLKPQPEQIQSESHKRFRFSPTRSSSSTGAMVAQQHGPRNPTAAEPSARTTRPLPVAKPKGSSWRPC